MDKKDLLTTENLKGEHGGFAFSLGAGVSVAVSLIFSLVVSLIAVLSKMDIYEITNNTAVILISFLLGACVCALTIFVFSLKFKLSFKSLYIQKKDKRAWVIYLATALISFGVIFGLSEINVYFLEFLEGLGLTPSAPTLPKFSVINFILVVLCVCVLPAVFEETLFRGIITYSLKGYGEVFAVIISGLAFSLFHMQPAQTIYQFIFGALFAFIALRTENILPVIISHFINNLFVVLNYYFWNFEFTGTIKIVVTVVALISLLVGVLLIALFIKNNENSKEKAVEIDKKPFFKSAVIGFIICLAMWLTNLV